MNDRNPGNTDLEQLTEYRKPTETEHEIVQFALKKRFKTESSLFTFPKFMFGLMGLAFWISIFYYDTNTIEQQIVYGIFGLAFSALSALLHGFSRDAKTKLYNIEHRNYHVLDCTAYEIFSAGINGKRELHIMDNAGQKCSTSFFINRATADKCEKEQTPLFLVKVNDRKWACYELVLNASDKS